MLGEGSRLSGSLRVIRSPAPFDVLGREGDMVTQTPPKAETKRPVAVSWLSEMLSGRRSVPLSDTVAIDLKYLKGWSLMFRPARNAHIVHGTTARLIQTSYGAPSPHSYC